MEYLELIIMITIGAWVATLMYKYITKPMMNEILTADKPPIFHRCGTETGRYTTDRSLITEVEDSYFPDWDTLWNACEKGYTPRFPNKKCDYCKRVECGCGGKDE